MIVSDLAPLIASAYGRHGPRDYDAWRPAYEAMMTRVHREYPGMVRVAYSQHPIPTKEDDPYANFTELWKAAECSQEGGARVQISSSSLAHPVLSEVDGWHWRAHHDAWHVILNHKGVFGFAKEVDAFKATVEQWGDLESLAMFVELVGQSAYFTVHGAFPTEEDGSDHSRQRMPSGSVTRWRALRDLVLAW